nr:immunoglobulin heavy chain junction region [Macaca mulatta]
CAKQDSNYDSW